MCVSADSSKTHKHTLVLAYFPELLLLLMPLLHFAPHVQNIEFCVVYAPSEERAGGKSTLFGT